MVAQEDLIVVFLVLFCVVNFSFQSETSDGTTAALVMSIHVTVFGEHKVAAVLNLCLVSFIIENTYKLQY